MGPARALVVPIAVLFINIGQAQEGSGARNRYHLGFDVGIPTDVLVNVMESGIPGGAFAIEFKTDGNIRPVVDFGFMYARGLAATGTNPHRNPDGTTSRSPDTELYSGQLGARMYTGREPRGFYVEALAGVNVYRVVLNDYYFENGYWQNRPRLHNDGDFTAALRVGVLFADRFDFSCRYQLIVDRKYYFEDGSNAFANSRQADPSLTQGLVVFRASAVLGGGTKEAGPAEPIGPTPGSGTCRAQLAQARLTVDSLQQALRSTQSEAIGLELQRDSVQSANAALEERVGSLEDSLQARQGSGAATPDPVINAQRFQVLHEDPRRFGAEAVYTVLHVFSDPQKLDTFRVVTTRTAAGGYRHELRIGMNAMEKPYRRAFFALALDGSFPDDKAGLELELLRVRMALAPDAFKFRPVTNGAWQASNDRDRRGIEYEDERATVEEIDAIWKDKGAIGFGFQSDPEVREVLVYSPRAGAVVNIEPLQP